MVKPERRGSRVRLIALEAAGVALALAAAAILFLHWRLSQGPVPLSIVEASAEAAIARSLPAGHTVDLVNPELVAVGEPGGLGVTVDGLVVVDNAGREVARVAETILIYSASDFLRGRYIPREIVASHAAFNIVRTTDRVFDFVTEDAGVSFADEPAAWRETLRAVHVIDADITFSDEASGRAWKSTEASARFAAHDEGFRLAVNGAFDIGGEPSRLELEVVSPGIKAHTEATLRLMNAPVSDILQTFYGEQAAVLEAPANGEAFVALDGGGAVTSSRIVGNVGQGVLRVGGRQMRLQSASLDAAFDPAGNLFRIDAIELETAAGAISFAGAARLRSGVGGVFAGVEFDFEDGAGQLAPGDVYDEALAFSELGVRGVYEMNERRLAIDEFSVRMLGVQVVGAGDIVRPSLDSGGLSPAITLNAAVVGALNPESVLKGWPKTAALGARDFVRDRIPAAKVENVALSLNLPAGSPDAGELADEALTLTFDISEAVAIYTPGMKPIRDGRGAARLTGNRFVIDGITGRIEGVALRDGIVDFTCLSPPGAPVHYRFTAIGDAAEVLDILNDEPLSVLASTGFTPDRFEGDVEVRMDIARPNRREVGRDEYAFDGAARFSNLSVSEFFEGFDLVGAIGSVDLTTDRILISADAALGEEPINLKWSKKLNAGDGLSTLRLAGVVDSSAGDIFGLSTRQLIRGPVAYEATALGEPGRIRSLDVNANFDGAALSLTALGWRKPQGEGASGRLRLAFDNNGVAIEEARLKGDEVDIAAAGRIDSGGAISSLQVERFILGDEADLTAKAERAPSGQLDAVLTGRRLTLGPLMQMLVDNETGAARSEFDWGRGVVIRGRIDELHLREDATFMDVSLDLRHGPDVLEAMEVSARTMDGAPLSASLQRSGDGFAGPRVDARSDDIGALVRGVFGMTSIQGGEGSMILRPAPRGSADRGLDGLLEARNLTVINAPLLARIFAAGSFDGLSALLNGDGISLNRAFAEFGFRDSVLTLREARATGPSVGITGSGRIAQGVDGAVVLQGAIAPAYQLNSLLGKTPIIGELFVNREGEGVVAISYDVTGSSGAPLVTVNPLSALAPGVLRRIFENDGPEADATAQETPVE